MKCNDMKDPIFIIGLTRSGSTLWHNIIAMNPEVCRLAEMHYLTPWRKDFRDFLKHVGDLSQSSNISKMVDLMFSGADIPGIVSPFWMFDKVGAIEHPDFKKEVYNKLIVSDRSLESIFKILIKEITHYSGYDQCCVKFPVSANHIPTLMEWFPNCKVVHIIRDPRAVAMSKTNDPSGTALLNEKYPGLKIIIRKMMIFWVVVQYNWASRIHAQVVNKSNYRLFKYEDLLSFPEETIRDLYEFISFDFDPAVVNLKDGVHEHQKSSLTGIRQKNINKKAAMGWMAKISSFEKWSVNLLTKSSMKRFGYDPASHTVYR